MTLHTTIKPTALSSRIDALRTRHRSVDSRVESEHQRPLPDTGVLQRLKKERLRLRDELSRYEGLMRTLSRGRAAA